MNQSKQEKYNIFLEHYEKLQRPLTIEEFNQITDFDWNNHNITNEFANQISEVVFFNIYEEEIIKGGNFFLEEWDPFDEDLERERVKKRELIAKFIIPVNELENYILKLSEILVKKNQYYLEELYSSLCINFIINFDLHFFVPELSKINYDNMLKEYVVDFKPFIVTNQIDDITPFIKFLKRFPQKFRVKTIVNNFIIEDATKEDLSIYENEKILFKELINLLNAKKGENVKLKDLSIELTITTNSDFKPVTTHILGKIIRQNQYYFKFDDTNQTVRLLSDEEVINEIIEYFKNNQKLLNEFPQIIDQSGFLAIAFIGKYFPFQESLEYVKTRPIIFIESILEKTNIEKFISTKDEDILDQKLPDIKYLKIFNIESSVESWIKENCSISFFPYDADRVKLLFPKLIERLSPILNLNNNPNNLFEYTIKQKINEYLSTRGLINEN